MLTKRTELVGARNKADAVVLVKLLGDVFAEDESGTTRALQPSLHPICNNI